jgi:hypothetical protein
MDRPGPIARLYAGSGGKALLAQVLACEPIRSRLILKCMTTGPACNRMRSRKIGFTKLLNQPKTGKASGKRVSSRGATSGDTGTWPAKVSLYDLQGRQRGYWSVAPRAGSGQLKTPVGGLANGLYLLQVETAEGAVIRQRVLKLR